MDFSKLAKYAKMIQDAVINENTAEALDKLAEYCKEGAELVRRLETKSTVAVGASGTGQNPDVQLDEIVNTTLACEQQCRHKSNQRQTTAAAREGFTGEPQKAGMDPATILFIFQTVVAIAKMIRERRQNK